MARIRASSGNGSARTAGVRAKTSSISARDRPCLPHLGQLPVSQSKPAIFMRRIYICLHKRNVGRSSDVGKGIGLSPMLACSTARKMGPEGRVKTQRGGQNAILVDIAHILQLQHPPEPCHCLEASPRAGRAVGVRGRDRHASMTALPTHLFSIVRRRDQSDHSLPPTSPFFAPGRVQASTSRANDRRS
jgi:hypothetical protein